MGDNLIIGIRLSENGSATVRSILGDTEGFAFDRR